MASAMQSVTVGVSDMEKALALFRDAMDLQVESDVAASPDLCAAWQLPPESTARLVEVSCAGYPMGRLRLAAFDPVPTEHVRLDHGGADSTTDVGPKAIDFYVPDPIGDAIAVLEEAGYRRRSEPTKWHIGKSISEELLFSGPDGMPMLLMVGHRHDPGQIRTLPAGTTFSEIATTSIVCGDLAASRRLYGEGLGLESGTDNEVTDEYRELACNLTGAPQGSRIHLLLYKQADEPSGKVLLVHFFEASTRRLTGRMRPGRLGVSLFTHLAPDLDDLKAKIEGPGVDIVTPPTSVATASGIQRLMLVKGPNEELLEFVEG